MIEITEKAFIQELRECELPVLACFTTRWCHTCYALCLIAVELAKEYKGKFKFFRVDAEENPGLIERYHINAVPTIVIFKDVQPIKKSLSFQDHDSFKSMLDSVIAK